MASETCAPLRILIGKKGPYSHSVGGEYRDSGNQCPNCRRPLVIYLNLDLNDSRLSFPDPTVRQVPVLYCLDCELFHFDFVYRICGGRGIEVLNALKSAKSTESGIKSLIRHRKIDVDLSPTPPELERLAAKLNSRLELTAEEELSFGQLTNNFAPADVGGYPIVDCYNQVGGRPFLSQRVADPDCAWCPGRKSRMQFLASICNERQFKQPIVPDDMQILCFTCPRCAAILVQHSA